MSSAISVAEAFLAAIEAGDPAAIASCYADEAVIWHNYDRAETTKAENIALLTGLFDNTSERRYVDRRLEALPDGFLQQHRLVATRLDGVELDLPACIVCRVVGDQIVRLDEYFDSVQSAPFLERP